MIRAMGPTSVQREIDRLHYLANERMREFCGNDLSDLPHGFSAIDYLSDGEREKLHLLNLGMTLTQPDEAAEAHQRILARHEARKQARLDRRSAS